MTPLHKLYTKKHVQHSDENGYEIVRDTSTSRIRLIQMDDIKDTWDIWVVSKSERALSAVLSLDDIQWTRLDCEAFAIVSRQQAEEFLERVGCRRKKPIDETKKRVLLSRLNK